MTEGVKSNLSAAEVKARVLLDASDWIRKFKGKTVVIKFGGNAMIDEKLEHAFASDVAFMQLVGIIPVVVHGGGPQISAELEKAGIQNHFVDGLRVTSVEAISVIREVLTNQIGNPLRDRINQVGGNAETFSGESSGLMTAEITNSALGQVGEVVAVNDLVLLQAIRDGVIPVISTIAPDELGNGLNVNADLAAAALAVALRAEKLVVLTDVPGLFSNWPQQDSLISEIGSRELAELLPNLEQGMIPKMQACLQAVEGGVKSAHIIDGRIEHSLLLEIFTEEGIGTLVSAS